MILQNKFIKKNLATNFESLADKIKENLENCKRKDSHELLRVYVDIFNKNIYATSDNTYKRLKSIINDPNIAVISGDRESHVVIINCSDYFKKLQHMIEGGIQNGVYIVTEDRTLEDLKLFCIFLYRNFKKYEHYEKILSTSNQPGQLYGTAKTHKFDNTRDITVDNLKFCPIIAQSRTYTYNAAQVIANYLKPLCSNNEYIIRNTQEFEKIIREQDLLKSNEQYLSYNVESLFTDAPFHETIEYIINEIYV